MWAHLCLKSGWEASVPTVSTSGKPPTQHGAGCVSKLCMSMSMDV